MGEAVGSEATQGAGRWWRLPPPPSIPAAVHRTDLRRELSACTSGKPGYLAHPGLPMTTALGRRILSLALSLRRQATE